MDRDSGLGRDRADKTLAKVANRFAKKDADRGGVCLLLGEASQPNCSAAWN